MPLIVGTDRLRRAALIVWTTVGVLVLIATAIFLGSQVRVIWLPIAFAAGLVFLLEPAVSALERARIARPIAVFIAFIAFLSVILAAGALVLPILREQADQLVSQLPDLSSQVIEWLKETGTSLGIDVEHFLTQAAIEEWLNDPANQETIQNILIGFGAGAGALISTVTETVVVILLAPILAIYILIDLARFKEGALNVTPPKHRDEVSFVSTQVSTAMGSFVRGQLLVALIVGVASSIGMWLIDLPFWLLVGILAGLLNLIPFLGPIVGGALAALVAILNGDVTQAIVAVAIFTGIQQVDNHVITPLVQRARVNLSPLVIVLALIIGGSLAGLLGVLVAVPVTAAIRIIVGHFWRTRMLGESWREASEHMIEYTEPPERFAGIRRRVNPNQSRLFDTQEMSAVQGEEQPPAGEQPETGDEPPEA
jgi:predicted PurR-regulated permease PerM